MNKIQMGVYGEDDKQASMNSKSPPQTLSSLLRHDKSQTSMPSQAEIDDSGNKLPIIQTNNPEDHEIDKSKT